MDYRPQQSSARDFSAGQMCLPIIKAFAKIMILTHFSSLKDIKYNEATGDS